VDLSPKLIEVSVPDQPVGAVLVLHGGAQRRKNMMVSPTQLSVLRMIPVARRIVRVGRGQLAVFRLLNSRRGWDTKQTPVHDAHWALTQIAGRLSDRLPVCLVGHSLGGRAALLTAGHPQVKSAAALAPWVYPTDVPDGLHDRRLLVVHGSQDRIASPGRSAALAHALSAHAQTAYVTVTGGKHAMLRHHALFDGLAADFARSTLVEHLRTGLIGRIEAGESWLET
jgi:pimeloyl-ACP methyl ester carboxylesterase